MEQVLQTKLHKYWPCFKKYYFKYIFQTSCGYYGILQQYKFA